ncbi:MULTISPECIES: PTS system trehalose-specific EIIBC component [unclassified Streptococcus]|uniref:PTS system trehalose-specific EIIBC component n=1 Tax=unclassified Streptococcus TaxID=2608887 RepID=UPI00107209B9|nr:MULTISPECIES: PTS system trehalose-specific EIIBC component [unclassified Streptococcus]MBF0805636.1 PTS system trehalose-specific EIIBC component [Streptococcus sp. 19428wA2_WM07]TFU28873.1 PTS trehalose transporter subunit IIBC [Streptococcus sp. WM07]
MKNDVSKIVQAIGGKDNINSVTHCVTRLRFILKDEGQVDESALDQIDLVKGQFSANGQYQVIIGPGIVDKAYDELVAQTGAQAVSKEEAKEQAAQDLNPLQKLVKLLGDVFVPILPAIISSGLLLGINNVLTQPGIFGAQSIVEMYPGFAGFAGIVNFIAATSFIFIPALVGWSAMTRFGGSPLLGIVLGLVLCHPGLTSQYALFDVNTGGLAEIPTWDLFGIPVQQMNYQAQVLPSLFAAFILANVEQWLNKRVPDSLKLLVVAPVSLLITGFLAFTVIGPVTMWLATQITNVMMAIFSTAGWLGGLIYGTFYAPLVITGMHHMFLPVDLQLVASENGTFLWPILVMSNVAQGSAALAMMLIFRKNKDNKNESMALTSAISAWLGVTEPAIFGVTLRHKAAFLAAMVSAGIAGALLGSVPVLANSVGIGGIPGILSIVPQYWGIFALGLAIVIALPIVLTFVFIRFEKKD